MVRVYEIFDVSVPRRMQIATTQITEPLT